MVTRTVGLVAGSNPIYESHQFDGKVWFISLGRRGPHPLLESGNNERYSAVS